MPETCLFYSSRAKPSTIHQRHFRLLKLFLQVIHRTLFFFICHFDPRFSAPAITPLRHRLLRKLPGRVPNRFCSPFSISQPVAVTGSTFFIFRARSCFCNECAYLGHSISNPNCKAASPAFCKSYVTSDLVFHRQTPQSWSIP
jgi:hypothetical protein